MSTRVVEVVVRGRFGHELIAALEGFDVATDERGLTRVAGPVADQSQLLGLLDMLDELHIEVVSVNTVDVDGFSPGGDDALLGGGS